MSEQVVIPWREVTPLEPVNGVLLPLLASVDSLRSAWKETIAEVSPEDFAEARRRSLRRHAIETGLIERLYDVSWGVTEALVAEGLTLEVAAREGGITEDALETIRVQFDALSFLAEAARNGRELSVFFVRELHTAITRHQRTFEGRDQFGQHLQRQLHHGDWKLQPNHVIRPDGSLLQYTPPDHVQAEMDRLITLYSEMEDIHPIIRAGWLHHRFITIHPFEDGNGRVARALVLLVLLRSDYAPLVVPARRRDAYISALDDANQGDLTRLTRLLAELEIVALRSELERPAERATEGVGAVDLARLFAERLRDKRERSDQERAAGAAALASDIQARVKALIDDLASQLREAFVPADPDARIATGIAEPPAAEARWWYAQLVRAANASDFFANLSEGSWWVRLGLTVLAQHLRYVVAVQKVGHGETGVLAVTAFAELVPPRPTTEEEERVLPTPLLETSSAESVTLVHTESLDARWPEIRDLIESTLAAAVAEFGRTLG